jgi:Arc/MetJ family transcription regulator
MRTTLNLDPELIQKAQELTKISEKTSLIHEGLKALIAQAARERLIALGGTEKKAKAPRRKRAA